VFLAHLALLLFDLAVLDLFLWGYLKSTLYKTYPANIDYLQ